MKSIKKPIFFIIAAAILLFSYLTVFGISSYHGDNRTIWIKSVDDIRWGIDIRGGVDVTFAPDPDFDGVIASSDIDAARSTIEIRMISKNITDYEIYTDYNANHIIVRFPWQASDTNFDPEEAVKELGETAYLTFWDGTTREDGKLVLTGADVVRASPFYEGGAAGSRGEYGVSLELNSDGAQKFGDATGRLAPSNGQISIWMDDVMLSAPAVQSHITGGNAQITGNFDADEAIDLANKINGGALPFKLVTPTFSVIEPTMGMNARNAMALAGAIAFVIICAFVIAKYKLLGVVATVGLTGQLFGALAVISGFFGAFDSFTMTIPGLAGIILSIGMGVDANIITAERIKEEIRSGKTLDGAVQSGYKRAFAAIFDGNVTVIIVAFILMGAFGTPDSFATRMLTPIFFAFGPSAAGAIYAFGYTLIIGVILNFIFAVFGARLMTYSLIKFNALRKLTFFGGYKDEAEKQKAESKKIYDAVANKRKFIMVPSVIIAVALVLTLVIGAEVAIEFRGGTILNYTYEGEIDSGEIRGVIEEQGISSANVKRGTSFESDRESVTIEFSVAGGLTEETLEELDTALTDAFSENDFSSAGEGKQNVNPTMGHSFFLKCLVAVIFSFLVLLVYIGLRFKKIGGWSSGFFAIVALLINVLIVFAAFVFFRFPIDANFMAVILTILCYSINDTIVLFDRIRENRQLHGARIGYAELVNKSVSQSFMRSMNTTITTCVSMLVISIVAYVMGIDSMLSFAIPLLFGLIVGFITSLFVAGPLWAAYQIKKNAK